MKWFVAVMALSGCGGDDGASSIDAARGDAAAADVAIDAPRFEPALVGSHQICKLLSNKNTSDPTANDVQHKSNVLGADLGISAVSNDKLYIFFGDTIGYRGIWPGNESHPDSVGYSIDSAAAVAADPSLLCSRLGIVSLPPGQSVGPGVDSSVQADFAGAAMIAPSGGSLATYIRDPAGPFGANAFPQLPGDFEVPSGAFSVGDAIYVFYTTVVSYSDRNMKASYLAKWSQPTTSGPFAYQILYAVDERFDSSGPLGGNFVNIAADVADGYVYLFGTGEYRVSPIHLARKPVAMIDQPGGFEDLGEIISTPGYGEISVRYFPSIGHWMLLATDSTTNYIVAYFAASPQGPWSAPFVVHDQVGSAFLGKYCCTVDDNCTGEQFLNCDQTGPYGTYLLPKLQETATDVTVSYTMSSFSPYNVALFQTTFTK